MADPTATDGDFHVNASSTPIDLAPYPGAGAEDRVERLMPGRCVAAARHASAAAVGRSSAAAAACRRMRGDPGAAMGPSACSNAPSRQASASSVGTPSRRSRSSHRHLYESQPVGRNPSV